MVGLKFSKLELTFKNTKGIVNTRCPRITVNSDNGILTNTKKDRREIPNIRPGTVTGKTNKK